MLEYAEPLTLCLYTRDLEASRQFYGGRLGLPLWREEPREALHYGAGGVLLTLRPARPDDLPSKGVALFFTVPTGIDQLCQELAARGTRFELPLSERLAGRSAMLRDPDGRELWICEPSATETQFHDWRLSRRQRERRVPVQRRPKVRRHERAPPSHRPTHPSE